MEEVSSKVDNGLNTVGQKIKNLSDDVNVNIAEVTNLRDDLNINTARIQELYDSARP